MKRFLPAWLLAALPAALLGHTAAYAMLGESMANARHAYFGPLLELSVGVFVIILLGAVAAALLRTGRIAVRVEGSLSTNWLKLSLAQLLIFGLLENGEGYAPSLVGCATQVVVALLVAVALVLFGRILQRCIAIGATPAYRARALDALVFALTEAPFPFAEALCVRVGTRRFQRPPPFA